MKHAAISSTVESLLKARALVEANWCQGFGQGGQVCAAEALYRISDAPVEAIFSLNRALPDPRRTIVAYNDDPGRTKADVLALYDRAIDLALQEPMPLHMEAPAYDWAAMSLSAPPSC